MAFELFSSARGDCSTALANLQTFMARNYRKTADSTSHGFHKREMAARPGQMQPGYVHNKRTQSGIKIYLFRKNQGCPGSSGFFLCMTAYAITIIAAMTSTAPTTITIVLIPAGGAGLFCGVSAAFTW